MATDLGFLPSDSGEFFYISYCKIDAQKVAAFVSELDRNGVPMWYDYNLDYGTERDTSVAEHIRDCKAVIMFISEHIFSTKKPEMQREYEMASDYYDKKVYVVFLDQVNSSDIPPELSNWWLEIINSSDRIAPDVNAVISGIGAEDISYKRKYEKMGLSDDELLNFGLEEYNSGNYSEAVAIFKYCASKGMQAALNNLCICYSKGIGVKQDLTIAFQYLQQEAELGSLTAINDLGVAYLEGRGVAIDYEKANHYFVIGMKEGSVESIYNMGVLYYSRTDGKADLQKAVKYFKEAADKGYAGAQGNLGYCYQNGLGVKQNIKKAIKYYKLAVKQGNSHAQLNLAICYFNGQGVKIDQDEAFRLLRLSAEQGNELAIRNLKRFGMM